MHEHDALMKCMMLKLVNRSTVWMQYKLYLCTYWFTFLLCSWTGAAPAEGSNQKEGPSVSCVLYWWDNQGEMENIIEFQIIFFSFCCACMTEELSSYILFVKSHWEVMCVDNVRIPWVKSLSLICSDLLQRFLCVALAFGWPACIAPAGSLAAGTLAVNDNLIGVCRWLAPLWQGCLPYTHAHMHTHISTTHFQPDSDGTILSTFSIWLWVTLWTSRSVLVHAEWREQCLQRHMHCASPLVSQTSVALHSFSGEFG